MKDLSTKIEHWFDKLDNRWRQVPIRIQRMVAILFFSLYALLSLYVIAKVCFDLGRASNEMVVEHIESPEIQKQPSPQKDIKNNLKN
ncbi:TraL conjugative transposon family protein [Sphingobacterium sp.]|uniref:TraL conjugative transposon family protein n=1 Tax=Sphingobacterium sp. TaxID=341027 RepID=UPI00258869F6|nr:TraL conjugative transposon family protein [Sphingobacterium sp.]WET69070.1 MAG: TraL conjugative transposon family protein [Sphingobacterium sp.]